MQKLEREIINTLIELLNYSYYDPVKIANYAFRIVLDADEEVIDIDQGLYDLVSDLMYMSADPQMELSKQEVTRKVDDYLNMIR